MGPTLTREMRTGRPLHLALASESGQLEVVQALLDHRADVDIEGGFDETPFQVATGY